MTTGLYSMPVGDISALVELAKKKLEEASVAYIGALNGWQELAMKDAQRKMYDKNAGSVGDIVQVDFSDETCSMSYEGLRWGWTDTHLDILLSNLTKKGRPFKQANSYSFDYLYPRITKKTE